MLTLRAMEEARLHSVMALLEVTRRNYDAQCQMHLEHFHESANTFRRCIPAPAPSKSIVKHASPVATKAASLVEQQAPSAAFVFKAVKLPQSAAAVAAPKTSARVTRSRAKQAEAASPLKEGPPLKKKKKATVQKGKPHFSPMLAMPTPNPTTQIPTTFVFGQQHATENPEPLQHTPGFGNKCRLDGAQVTHHTPVFGRAFKAEASADAAAGVSHLVQADKVLDRMDSCLTSDKATAHHQSSFEFLQSAAALAEALPAAGTPGLPPQHSMSGSQSRHHCAHDQKSSTPEVTAADKENRNPDEFWNNTGKKILPSSPKRPATSARKALSESRRANQMAPPQPHDSKKEAPVFSKRTRRQLALGCPDKAAEEPSVASPSVAAELADLDNVTSSITKRTPRLSKNFMEAHMIMREEQALILQSQREMARAIEAEQLVVRSAQKHMAPANPGSASRPSLQTAGDNGAGEVCIPASGLGTSVSAQDAPAPQSTGRGTLAATIAPAVVDPPACALLQGPSGEAKVCVVETSAATAQDQSPAVMDPPSYVISPYKDCSDEDEEEEEDEDRPQKLIPFWAWKENLLPELMRLQYVDPEAIFTAEKSCSLTEVFGTDGSKKRPNFARRNSSGNWLEDNLTWEEEQDYKVRMGYIDNRG